MLLIHRCVLWEQIHTNERKLWLVQACFYMPSDLALHQVRPNCQSWRNKHPPACILTFIPQLEGTTTNIPPKLAYAISHTDSCNDWQAGNPSDRNVYFILAELLYLVTLLTEQLNTNLSPSLLQHVPGHNHKQAYIIKSYLNKIKDIVSCICDKY